MSDYATEAAAAPGTGETPPAQPDPTSSAGTQNAEGDGGTPETVPYSRFKEVNDAYRPFKELTDSGYDADSLRRLAEWEVQFSSAPVESWLSLAERIEGMPESVVEAIRQASDGQSAPSGQASAPPHGSDATGQEDDGPPAWAEPLIQDYSARMADRESAARNEVLDNILNQWRELDKSEGITDPEGKLLIPDSQRLSYIAGAAGSGTSAEEILQIARREALEMVELARKSMIVPSGGPGAPRSVPGGTAAPSAPPTKIRTLADATRAAKADLEAGRLQR